MRTSEEKALGGILRSEVSRQTFQKIQDTFGKQQTHLTQVDVLSTDRLSTSPHTTLRSQEGIEQKIMDRNRRHSLQSLQTPFLSNYILQDATDPTRGNSKIMEISNGTREFTSKRQHLTQSYFTNCSHIVNHCISPPTMA